MSDRDFTPWFDDEPGAKMTKDKDISHYPGGTDKYLRPGPVTYVPPGKDYSDLCAEINLLSGRVDITLRLLGRLVAKIDPGYLDDPLDPDVRRRSDLLGETVINKMKVEALTEASSDPERFDKLKRYFKDMP